MTTKPEQNGPPTQGKTAATSIEVADDWDFALAAYAIRKLRAAIEFARWEPEFLPPSRDEDTGEYGPTPHREPTLRVTDLIMRAMENPLAFRMMLKTGWTADTMWEDWDTMLSRLPTSRQP